MAGAVYCMWTQIRAVIARTNGDNPETQAVYSKQDYNRHVQLKTNTKPLFIGILTAKNKHMSK